MLIAIIVVMEIGAGAGARVGAGEQKQNSILAPGNMMLTRSPTRNVTPKHTVLYHRKDNLYTERPS